MKDKSEPAFPLNIQADGYAYKGMTLRDFFAAKAMQGLLAFYGEREGEELAWVSYAIADVMVEEREKDRSKSWSGKEKGE